MKRSIPLLLLPLLFLAFRCQQPSPQDDTAASQAIASDTARTDTAATDTAGTTGTTVTTSSAPVLTTPASTVFVTFTGLTTFANTSAQEMRVAMIQGETGNEHTPLLTLPDDVKSGAKTPQKFLEDITGGKVDCKMGRCEIKIVKPISVQIVDADDEKPSPKPFSKDLTYKQLMPHLKALAPAFTTLDDDFAKTVPSGTDIIAFFNVNGGTLSAVPYCGYIGVGPKGTAKYEKWASQIYLVATTDPKTAKLQIHDGTTLHDVTFTDSKFIDIRFENQARNSAGVHFTLHKKAEKDNTAAKFPGFQHDRACHVPAGIPVGCAMTEWP
jgi:hypothetical protein